MKLDYKVFVIVVTYNGMRNNWISNCLVSITKSSYPAQIIVVDNASSDNTSEYVRQYYPEVLFFQQHTNLGFGQANNIGIRYAISHNADYIMLLNQDATIAEDCIERLLSESDGQSLLSPIHCNGNGDKLDRMFCYTLRNAGTIFYDDIFINGQLKDKYEVGEVPAACWFLPVDTVKIIGGFNPIFHHYGEDNNYYSRLKYHHIKAFLVPKARMYHDRKIFGNIGVFNKNRLRRDMLLVACNINNGFGMRMLLYIKLLYRCYVEDLKHKNYNPGGFLLSLFWIIVHHSDIVKSRRNERKRSGCWLNNL